MRNHALMFLSLLCLLGWGNQVDAAAPARMLVVPGHDQTTVGVAYQGMCEVLNGIFKSTL